MSGKEKGLRTLEGNKQRKLVENIPGAAAGYRRIIALLDIRLCHRLTSRWHFDRSFPVCLELRNLVSSLFIYFQ